MFGKPTFVFDTTDGKQVRVYPATPQEEPALVQLLDRATPEYRLSGNPSRVAAHAGGAVVDLLDGCAWIAYVGSGETDGVAVAAARFYDVQGEQAEVSVVVRDDMQGRGIGSRMLYFLLDQARAAGVRRARTSFESGNEAAWQVLQYSPYHITWQPRGGLVDVLVHLQARASVGATMN